MQPFAEPPPTAKPKSGSSGCTILLIVFGAFCLLVVLGIGVGIYALYQDPMVRDVATAVGGMMNAPGRQELMAAGCDQAMVVDMRDFAKLAEHDPNHKPEEIAEIRNAVFINCLYMKDHSPTLDCDGVARIYRDQVAKDREVHVLVQEGGKEQPTCSGRYDLSGVRQGEAFRPPSTGGPNFGPNPPPPTP